VNPQFWWYVARASGIVAWVMSTAAVVWGVLLSTRAFPRHRRPAWLLDLHRWLGALTVAFVAIHLGALVADSYTHFALVDLAVPLASSWRPGAVALGVVATWLLLAVELTSLAMRRLPRQVWRRIHMCSYVVFWLTSLHAAFAGTDRTQPLYRITAVVVVTAVAIAALRRITEPPPIARSSTHRGT
jgi:DMSO/TMAO reductase YedYZ heme-binding membrane subunit